MYYRLEDKRNELPLHWAYQDAFEVLDGKLVDNRSPGFQVWSQLHRVISVAAGESAADGQYDAADYPFFVLIEASDVYDGAGEWFAVRCEDVECVKVVETATLIKWAKENWISDIEDGYDYEDDFEKWCEDSEDEIIEWLAKNLQTIEPKFVETL